jgi:hypothetical protein
MAAARRPGAAGIGEAHTVRHTTCGKFWMPAETTAHSLLQILAVRSLPWSVEHLADQGSGTTACLQIRAIDLQCDVSCLTMRGIA